MYYKKREDYTVSNISRDFLSFTEEEHAELYIIFIALAIIMYSAYFYITCKRNITRIEKIGEKYYFCLEQKGFIYRPADHLEEDEKEEFRRMNYPRNRKSILKSATLVKNVSAIVFVATSYFTFCFLIYTIYI